LIHKDNRFDDENGAYFDSLEAAQRSAVQSLLEIAKGRKPIDDATELMFVVRDAANRQAFTTRLLVLVTL
jgi:hypothetical protein